MNSDLVGLYLFFVKDNQITNRGYVAGVATHDYFIVEYLNSLTGEFSNVCKIMHISEIEDRCFVVNGGEEEAKDLYNEYKEKGRWIY